MGRGKEGRSRYALVECGTLSEWSVSAACWKSVQSSSSSRRCVMSAVAKQMSAAVPSMHSQSQSASSSGIGIAPRKRLISHCVSLMPIG